MTWSIVKKSVLTTAVLWVLLFALSACGKEESHQRQQLRRYLRKLPQMEQYRIGQPLKEWKDNSATVAGFKRQIEDYRHRITKLELMKPMRGELRTLHEMYVEANKRRMKAWHEFLGSYDGGHLDDRMLAYDQAMAGSDSLFSAFYRQLEERCENHGLPAPNPSP